MRIIDVNASSGFWPIQHFTDRSLDDLDLTFARQGIDEVWLSAIESILYPEPDTHDQSLFEKIENNPRFRPVKTVNPLLGNFNRSLAESARRFPLAAIKLFPNYHGYSLMSPFMAELCGTARELGLPVLIQMRINDERNQPAFLQVHGVSAREITQLSLRHPDNVIIALCAYNHEPVELNKGSSNLLVDLSFLDGCNFLLPYDNSIPIDRFVFGSHAPFLHVASAKMKLTHFENSEQTRRAIAGDNLLRRLNGKVPCCN